MIEQINPNLLVKLCGNISANNTDEDPSLRIESSAIINLRGVSTKLNKYIVFTMQTYKKLINPNLPRVYRRSECLLLFDLHAEVFNIRRWERVDVLFIGSKRMGVRAYIY